MYGRTRRLRALNTYRLRTPQARRPPRILCMPLAAVFIYVCFAAAFAAMNLLMFLVSG